MALKMNNHVFKGHKTILGSKYVTYGEVELPLRYDLYSKSSGGFDWGHNGPAAMQLGFAVLYQVSGKEAATKHTVKFTQDVIKRFNTRDWVLNARDVIQWVETNSKDTILEQEEKQFIISEPLPIKERQTTPVHKLEKKRKSKKDNVVKMICKELGITQKQLAEILEVPEGTVSSWAVKNEIPRLGKKAIEFYTANTRNQKIVDSYKAFMLLLEAS